jgi:hypothetical protein
VRKQNLKVEASAKANLAATKHTPRIAEAKDPADIYFPAEIETSEHDVDCFTTLHAPDAMALEYGHAPSGFFKDTDTKPPAATYILNRAAYG